MTANAAPSTPTGESVKLLLEAQASVDLPVRSNRSRALNEAAASADRDRPRTFIVELLLDAHAAIDLGTVEGGWTALQTAAEYGNIHVLLQLVERG